MGRPRYARQPDLDFAPRTCVYRKPYPDLLNDRIDQVVAMTALIRFVLAVLAGAMIDDADLDEVFSDSLDMGLDAVQHPLEVGGVVGSAAVIVIDHLLVLITTQARRSRL